MNYTTGKIIITVAALVLACNIAAAQKKTAAAKQQGTSAARGNNAITEQQAYAIIKYANAVIDLHNSYIKALESHQSTLTISADGNIAKLKRSIETRPYAIMCDRNVLSPQSDKANRTILKTIPAIPEKQSLQTLSTQALMWYDKTNTHCTEISSYFSKDDYKNDNAFAQYGIIKDSMLLSIKQSASYWREFAQLAANAGDRAELVLLKKSKLAMYVIPMKQSLMGIQQVNTMLSDENTNIDSINAKLANVQVLITQKINDKSTDFSKLNDLYYKEVYTNFFRDCNYTTTTLQTVIDKIKAKASSENISSAYSSASTTYNNAVEAYNTFIKQ